MSGSYIQKRRQGWYYRRRVPRDIQGQLGTKVLFVSLKTRDKGVAQKRAFARAAADDAQWERLRRNPLMRETPNTVASLEDLVAYARVHREELLRGDWGEDYQTADWESTERADSLIVKGRATEAEVVRAIEPALSKSLGRRLLSEVMAEHAKEMRLRQRREATIKHREAAVREFIAAMEGDRFVDTYSRAECRSFIQDHLQLAGLSRNTVKNRISALHAVFATACDAEYTDSNPFANQTRLTHGTTRGTAEDEPSRKPWTESEICAVAVAEIAGKHSRGVIQLVLIAAYTGMRREEIATAKADQWDGKFLRIREGKNKNSVRYVPIPDTLRPLIVQLAKNPDEDGFLIHNLTSSNADGKRGNCLNNPISKLLKAAGVNGDVVFHELRNTYITLLENKRLLQNEIQQIVGHEKQGMSLGTYSGGIERQKLYQQVKGIKYSRKAQAALAKRIRSLLSA